ncbi:hypothetical protein BH11PLA1_BH11PLA1_19620 [soil metagenome]
MVLTGSVAVVFGVVVNYGVAWGIASRYQQQKSQWTPHSTLIQYGDIQYGNDKMLISWISAEDRAHLDAHISLAVSVIAPVPPGFMPSGSIPNWIRVPATGRVVPTVATIRSVAAGWPFIGLTSAQFRCHGAPKPTDYWAIVLADGPTHYGARLPCLPVWPAFAANVAIFGSVLFVPTALVQVVRHVYRRRRGCCAKCGYSLEALMGEKCPECATPITRLLDPASAVKAAQ